MASVSRSYLRFSVGAWAFFLLVAGLGFFTPNPFLTGACLLALPFFATLLWRRGEPPVLFFIVAFQWLEVSTKVFHADWLGVKVEEMFGVAGPVNQAILLGLAGLTVLAIGMRLGMARLLGVEASLLRQEGANFSVKKLFSAYVISVGASLVLRALARRFFPLANLLIVTSNLKWVLFFALIYTVAVKRRGKIYLFLATGYELLIGITGYFSRFNYVLYILILAFSAVGYRLTLRKGIQLAVLVSLGLLLSSLWMAIRFEYRPFLSGGERRQAIVVPFRARVDKIVELVNAIDRRSLGKGFESLLGRIAYVDIFAQVLDYVPRSLPHENGKMWLSAVSTAFMPRILFPGKPEFSYDSEATMKYTGTYQTGIEFGTSISMGYMAESYIDFGRQGMFVPIFTLGLLFGLIFRYLTLKTKSKLFGFGLSVAVLVDSIGFGSSTPKLLGGLSTGFLVMILAQKFLVPHLVKQLLQGKQ